MTNTQEVHRIEMQQACENYILGRLSQEEIDELWVQFLKAPDLFEYFEIYIHLSTLEIQKIKCK